MACLLLELITYLNANIFWHDYFIKKNIYFVFFNIVITQISHIYLPENKLPDHATSSHANVVMI